MMCSIMKLVVDDMQKFIMSRARIGTMASTAMMELRVSLNLLYSLGSSSRKNVSMMPSRTTPAADR